jgi:hypothetical protein
VTHKRLVAYVAGVVALVAVSIVASDLDWSGNDNQASAVVRRVHGYPRPAPTFARAVDKALESGRPGAAWGPAGQIYIMLWGSSTCPSMGTHVHAQGDDALSIETGTAPSTDGDNLCTADLGITTSVVRLPDQIDNTKALTVTIDGRTTLLPARSNN